MKKTHLLVLVGAAVLATSCATAVAISTNGGISPTDIGGGGGGDNPLTNLTVTFDFNGGTCGGQQTVTFNDVEPTSYFYYVKQRIEGQITPPTHYEFTGNYSLSPDGSTGNISDTYIIKENNLIFYAQYETHEHYATVHWMDGYDPQNPVLIEDEIYFTGETPNFKGNIPYHEGAAFYAWDPTPVAITEEDEVTYTALYVPAGVIHAVTLDYNNGSGGEEELHYQIIVDGYNASEPIIANPGKTLENWTYVEPTTKAGQVFDFATTITEDITIEANWTNDVYDITYVPNGGTITQSQTTAGYNDTLPAPTISRDGYTLAGWYTTPTFEVGSEFVFQGGTTPTQIKGDTTLFAKWGDIQTFDIKFYDDSATPVEYTTLAQTVNYGEGVRRPTNPTKEHYTFAGWYTDTTYGTEYPFDTALTGVTGEFYNAYAKFEHIVHRVTFNAMQGSIAGTDYITVNENDTVSESSVPTVTPPDANHVVENWYTDSTFQHVFTFDTDLVSSDMTLYAKYTIKDANSFSADSWEIFFNEINSKTFEQLKTNSAYSDDWDVNDTFVGLTRNVNITNVDGTTSVVTAKVIDENDNAGVNDNKFTFMITIDNAAKFNAFDGDNYYINSTIRSSVENYIYRIESDLFSEIKTTTQTCFNALPGQAAGSINTKLFVPSVSQVYGGTTPYDEGAQFDLFKDSKTDISGAWLRTPRENTAGLAYYADGDAQKVDDVTATHKVCAAFVI